MKSDVGVVRQRNEDSAYVDPDGRFVLLADGMGGHGAGDVASAMAIDVVRTCLEHAEHELACFGVGPRSRRRARVRALLERAFRLCNDAVLSRSKAEPDKHQMGTTLEVVVLLGGEAFVAHVGDSRTYLVRRGAASQLTSDHTIAEVMRRAGTLSERESRTSDLRSVLANAIGVTPGVSVEHAHVVLEPGDRLLVCSDGLYDYFTLEQLAELASEPDLGEALERMVAEARALGGHDNITGVVLQAGDTPLEELDDAPTNPVAVHPFGVVPEDTLGSIVDHVLRETTQPYGA